MPLVSIVVRSKNDMRYIEQTLNAIQRQSFSDFELICADSGSTDGTLEIIKGFAPKHIMKIPPEEYIPGKVLNDAVQLCSGKIIVFNNSDCIPQGMNWLTNLTAPLLDAERKNTVAVFCDQHPRPEARPLVRKDHVRAFGDGTVSAGWQHFFSLASSAILTELLLHNPFDETLQYSEDVEWSLRMKKLGYCIDYIPEAHVEHSHNYSLQEVWTRFYNEGLAEGRIYRSAPAFFKDFIMPCTAELLRDWKFLLSHFRIDHIPYGLVYRLLQRFAMWKGRRDYFK
ncbi:glycosyltransferase family 2 protein [Lentisphaerota bacterium ZTH]|nr:glycosyltransferase family 2 protein [Lentisphaerota bacterium]WET07388.1 glycosyltransferase family 2 protein [Lentisphaerota bacterium ZTH]